MQESAEKPLWIVIALVGLLIVPVIFIIGLVVGINISGNIDLSPDTLSSWISAFATVAIAILTFILAKETWYLRIAQIRQINELRKESVRPNLEFYLLSAPVSFQFLNIHIENNGKGVARDIKFTFTGENDAELTQNEDSVIKRFLSVNILRNGMHALGAGKQRTTYIFNFLDLSKAMGDDVFNIKINISMSYVDIEGRDYTSDSVIDFSEFKGISEIGGGDPIYNLYEETKKIREVFESAQRGLPSKRINVNSFSSTDRMEEKQRMMDHIEEHKGDGS